MTLPIKKSTFSGNEKRAERERGRLRGHVDNEVDPSYGIDFFLIVSSQLIMVFNILTENYSFELLVLTSTVRKTTNSLTIDKTLCF